MAKRIISLAVAAITRCIAIFAGKPHGLSSRRVFLDAQKKTSQLNDISTSFKANLKLMQGTEERSLVRESINTFIKNAKSDNPIVKIETARFDTTTVSYYIDGYTYTEGDLHGKKGKKTKSKTTDSDYENDATSTLFDYIIDIIKYMIYDGIVDYITAEKQVDGATLLNFAVNKEKFQNSDYANEIFSVPDDDDDEDEDKFEDADIKWDKIDVTVTVNADGYISKAVVNADYSMQIGEETLSYEKNIEASYNNIGEPVEFEIPNPDEYEEVSEDDPEFDS